MSAYGPWSACSVRCGTGTMTRTRTCIQGGPCSTPCSGPQSETRSCGSPIGMTFHFRFYVNNEVDAVDSACIANLNLSKNNAMV